MVYVPGCEWDVFVSYARNDDEPDFPEERGWVSTFVDVLRAKVRGLLGEEIRLFFDRPAAGAGNANLTEMKIAAQNSAIFVAIASPSYCKRKWPMAELESFQSQCDDPHRLFVAEHLPRGEGDTYPPILAEKNYREFWRRLTDFEGVAALPPGSDQFRACMTDFGFKLQRQLRKMRREAEARTATVKSLDRPAHVVDPEPMGPGATPPPASTGVGQEPSGGVVTINLTEPGPPSPPAPVRTVLLAQVTDDVAALADEVRGYLEQFREVVATLPDGAYPQGGDAFRTSFLADLEAADIFVQLLGSSPGRAPPDLPDGYARFQLNAARAAGKTILLWRHPELDLASVENEAHRAALNHPHVLATGLEEFKAQIIECARKRDDKSGTCVPTCVFVNADRDNLMTARGIATLFSAANYDPRLPKFDGSVQENRLHLNRMMKECGVLFVVNGDAPPIWWSTQKNLFNTLRGEREAQPSGLAVCSVPPAEEPPPEMIDDEFEHIDCTDGWSAKRVRDYIAKLKQRVPPTRPRPRPGEA